MMKSLQHIPWSKLLVDKRIQSNVPPNPIWLTRYTSRPQPAQPASEAGRFGVPAPQVTRGQICNCPRSYRNLDSFYGLYTIGVSGLVARLPIQHPSGQVLLDSELSDPVQLPKG